MLVNLPADRSAITFLAPHPPPQTAAARTWRRLLTGRSLWLHSASSSPGAARGSGAHPAVWFSANRCTEKCSAMRAVDWIGCAQQVKHYESS